MAGRGRRATQRTQGQRTNKSTPMPDLPTMAQSFRDAGYQAFGVGKLHVVPNRDRIGFDDVILNNENMRKGGDHGDDWHQYMAERGYPGQATAHGLCNVDYMTRTWHLPGRFRIWTRTAASLAPLSPCTRTPTHRF